MPSLVQIAALLQCPAPAVNRAVTGVATLDEAGESDLSFVAHDKFLPALAKTRAAAVIVQNRVHLPAETKPHVFLVGDTDIAIARVLELFAPPVPRPPVGVDPSARVALTAQLELDVAVGAGVYVGENVRIGRGTVLHSGVYIGDDTLLGERCELFPNVVVRERITLGNRVIIHAGSVLGTDGFGYRWDGKQHVKIPQIGTVIIEDDVEIGSCVCIDRAKLSATRIGRGTKIDNLVQIGHNVQIGPHCIIVGQAGVAGSAKLGAGVVLGGQVAVRDHITIGDGVTIAARSAVVDDIEPGAVVSGTPAMPHRQHLREQQAMRHLPEIRVHVRKLEEEIEALKKQFQSQK